MVVGASKIKLKEVRAVSGRCCLLSFFILLTGAEYQYAAKEYQGKVSHVVVLLLKIVDGVQDKLSQSL